MSDRRIVWSRWREPFQHIQTPEGENIAAFPVFATPFGFVSQKMQPGLKSDMKFYVGDTNFDIGQVEAEIINNSEGVDIFDIFTRYRFRVSPGKCFKAWDVMRNIEINLGCKSKYGLTEATIYELRALKSNLYAQKKKWIVFVLPNGKYEYYVDNNDNVKFNNMLAKYKESQKIIMGSIVFTSDGV